MISIFVALLLLALVALGAWLDSHPWAPPRVYFTGPPTLADCLQAPPKKGVRRG